MNRTKTVIRNMMWEFGYYLFVIVLGFLAPRYIILAYGSSVNGLSSTITQILNIILLLQAGATTAAIYSLYKPIADNDMDNICKNVAHTETFFKKISFVFCAVMFLITIAAPFVIHSEINRRYIFIAFLIMGLKSFLDLYFTAKYRIVFTAYQEKYYISIATLTEQIVYYLLVFGTILIRAHFIFIYVWFLFGCVVKVIYLNVVYRKKHSDIITKKYMIESGMIGGRNYALANEVSHSIMSSSATIILSFMYGLKEASVYSIYALVNQALSLVASSIYSSFSPSFGNLLAQEKSENASDVFCIFQYIFLMLNTFLMMCMSLLIIPFIRIYTSEINDINYENPLLAAIMVIGGILSTYRIPYNVIVSACGYFKETWKQSVITVFVSIAISVSAGSFNYTFILLGPIIFYAVNFLYQYYRIKELRPSLITARVFSLLFISLSGVGITFVIDTLIEIPPGVVWWIIFAMLFSLASAAYLIIFSLIFDRKDLIASVRYIYRFYLKIKKSGNL